MITLTRDTYKNAILEQLPIFANVNQQDLDLFVGMTIGEILGGGTPEQQNVWRDNEQLHPNLYRIGYNKFLKVLNVENKVEISKPGYYKNKNNYRDPMEFIRNRDVLQSILLKLL